MWTSSPTITVIRGARCSPSASTFQPARRSTSWRAAARQVKFAMWQPVTNPTELPRLAGRADRAASADTTSSMTADGRRHDVQRAVLIPRAGQPVGGHRHRHRAAGDEPEIARTGARDHAGIGGAGQLLDHPDRIVASLRQADRRAPHEVRRRPQCRRHGAWPRLQGSQSHARKRNRGRRWRS